VDKWWRKGFFEKWWEKVGERWKKVPETREGLKNQGVLRIVSKGALPVLPRCPDSVKI
jgi:hypothetical protein